MIATLTPNPSLDRTMVVGRLDRGAVIRARRNWTEPAGKGVNISRALHANGVATTAVFPSGGSNGAEIARLLDADGVDFIAVPIVQQVRSNVSIVEPDGTTTKLNEAGPTLAAEEVESLIETCATASSVGGWVAASGSLAPGMPTDFYALLAQRLRPIGATLAVDTSGAALRESLGESPSLVKPNRHELGELLDGSLDTLGEVLDAARELLAMGAGQALVSLGPDGALLVDGASEVHAEVHVDEVGNTVGAGDALLAGFLAGGGLGVDALKEAMAWARAAVRSEQTMLAPPGQTDRTAVVVHDQIDVNRKLSDDEPVAPSTGRVRSTRSAGAGHATRGQSL